MKNKKQYPIKWHIDIFVIKETGSLGHLGICNYSKKIAFISDDENLKITEIKNITIDNNKCPKAKECLNLKCNYNKTTASTFVNCMNQSPQEIKKELIRNRFNTLTQLIINIEKTIHKEHPDLLNFKTNAPVKWKKPIIKCF